MTTPLDHLKVARMLRASNPLSVETAPRPPTSRRVRGGAALLVPMVLFLAFTAPGRAAVGWVAESVGIAETGEPPTLDDRSIAGSSTFSSETGTVKPDFTQHGPAVVIGSGRAPDGTPFEVVGYRAPEATCVSFEWPTIPRSEPSCYADGIDASKLGPFAVSSPDKHEPFPDTPVAFGEAGSEVQRVELRYGNPSGEVKGTARAQVFTFGGNLAARIGGGVEPLKAFIGFLPAELTTDELVLQVRAYDAGGRLLQTRMIDVPRSQAERQSDLRRIEDAHEAFLNQLKAALASARAGTLKADVDQERAAETLEQAIGLMGGEIKLEGGEANRLEDQMTALLDELREAGDLPATGPVPPG